MAYEQAQIPVQKVAEFEHLRAAIERIFSSAAVAQFCGRLESKGIAAREFEKVLAQRLLEQSDARLLGGSKSAADLYDALSQSDQAMMREFYLERLERVDPRLRLRYRKVYEYR